MSAISTIRETYFTTLFRRMTWSFSSRWSSASFLWGISRSDLSNWSSSNTGMFDQKHINEILLSKTCNIMYLTLCKVNLFWLLDIFPALYTTQSQYRNNRNFKSSSLYQANKMVCQCMNKEFDTARAWIQPIKVLKNEKYSNHNQNYYKVMHTISYY